MMKARGGGVTTMSWLVEQRVRSMLRASRCQRLTESHPCVPGSSGLSTSAAASNRHCLRRSWTAPVMKARMKMLRRVSRRPSRAAPQPPAAGGLRAMKPYSRGGALLDIVLCAAPGRWGVHH
jgi:hypothetical protein